MQREKFGSKFGALVVIAGAAVGLGNIWRFPYMVGTNGGAAFIIIYLIFVALICIPCMVAEMSIGRRSSRDAVGAFSVLAPQKPLWKGAGFLYVLIPTLILSYYCVIGGLTIDYFLRSLGICLPQSSAMSVFWMVVFLLITAGVVIGGVQKGIERFSKVMMPLLFLIVIFIAVRAMTLPAREGASATALDGVRFLFKPDFSKVTMKTCLDALGQAFFSLSLGSGVLMTYGSYVRKKDSLFNTASSIAISDLVFALIAGCAIIPAVFALNADPMAVLSNNTDSALVFNILPQVFPMMPLGGILEAFFFFALIIAALTSSVSLFEVPVCCAIEQTKLSRKAACAIVAVVIFLLGLLSALRGTTLNFIDALCANWLMPLGGLLALIFVGWTMKKSDFEDELTNGGMHLAHPRFLKVLRFAICYLAPTGVLAVFLFQLLK